MPGIEQAHVGGRDRRGGPIVRLLPGAVHVVQQPEPTCVMKCVRVRLRAPGLGLEREGDGEEGASQRAYTRYFSELAARNSYSLSGAPTEANIFAGEDL